MNKFYITPFLVLCAIPVLGQTIQPESGEEVEELIFRDSNYYEGSFENKNLLKLAQKNIELRSELENISGNMPVKKYNYTPFIPILKPDPTFKSRMPTKHFKK